MNFASFEFSDRRSTSGSASVAHVTQPYQQPADERMPIIRATNDLVAAQPDTIADHVAQRRRETRMRRLAKVPIPLDQRIVQGPLREPKVAKTVFGAKIGNLYVSRDLINDYLTARSRLEYSPTARSLIMQMEDGRTDAGRSINLKLVRACPSIGERFRTYWRKDDPGTAIGRITAAYSRFGMTALVLTPGNFTSRRLPVQAQWDPRDALITSSGRIMSPALSLAHEFTHALHLRDGSLRFIRASREKFGQYTNVEELRTIRMERIMARELGEGVRQSHGEGVSVLAHSTHGDHSGYPLAVNDANIRMVTTFPHSSALSDMLRVQQEIFCADGRQPLGPAPRLRNSDGTRRKLPADELIAYTVADGTPKISVADRMFRSVEKLSTSELNDFVQRTGICSCPTCKDKSEVRSLQHCDGTPPA